MKLNKSTTILLNVVLFLLVVLLVKSIITIPKSVYANAGIRYEIVGVVGKNAQQALNVHAQSGWKLNSYSYDFDHDTHYFVFEQ